VPHISREAPIFRALSESTILGIFSGVDAFPSSGVKWGHVELKWVEVGKMLKTYDKQLTTYDEVRLRI